MRGCCEEHPLSCACCAPTGLQEKKVVNPTLVHDMYRRSASPDAAPGPGARAPAAAKGSGAIGPPRPPAAAGAPAVGPPRPPASFGPPRPPARGDAGAGQGPAVGPPRPPARGGDQGHRGPGGEAEGQGEGEDVGPSRLPQREEGEGEEEGDVGPPRPPSGAEDDDDDVGPPRPPPGGFGAGAFGRGAPYSLGDGLTALAVCSCGAWARCGRGNCSLAAGSWGVTWHVALCRSESSSRQYLPSQVAWCAICTSQAKD